MKGKLRIREGDVVVRNGIRIEVKGVKGGEVFGMRMKVAEPKKRQLFRINADGFLAQCYGHVQPEVAE